MSSESAMNERVDYLIYIHGRASSQTDDRWLHDGLNPLLDLLDRRPVSPSIRVLRPYYGDIITAKSPPEASYPSPLVEQRGASWHTAAVRYDARLEELRELRGFRPKPGFQGRFLDTFPANGGSSLYIKKRMPDVHRYITSDRTRRAVLQRLHAELPRGGRALLVAHSLGTVVALDLLHYLHEDLHIDLLVTLGSPLALGPLRKELMGSGYNWPYQHVGGWVNLYDPADFVTAGESLEPVFKGEVLDFQVDNGRKDVHRGYRYTSHGSLGRVVGPLLSDERTLPLPVDANAELVDVVLLRALARRIQAETPPGSNRRKRMSMARARTERELLSSFQRHHPRVRSLSFSLTKVGEWLENDERRLERLVALYFANPFAPFEVEYREHEQAEGIRAIGLDLGLSRSQIETMLAVVKEAESVHDPGKPWGRIIAGAGVAVLVLAAPYAVAGLGAAGGLGGGAALAHGLATVGRVVGGGMLGGIGTVGAVTAGGSALVARQITLLTTEQLESELIRLQSLAKLESDLQVGSHGADAVHALQDLEKELGQLKRDYLEVEGSKSAGSESLDGKLAAISRALKWLDESLGSTQKANG